LGLQCPAAQPDMLQCQETIKIPEHKTTWIENKG